MVVHGKEHVFHLQAHGGVEMKSKTIPELVARSADEHKGNIALRMRRGGRFFEISFEELKQETEDMAAGLQAKGVKPGARIAILSENRPEWAIAYLATLRAGCASVPLCPQLKAHELKHILSVAGCEYLFASASFAEVGAEITDGLPSIKGIISLDGDGPLSSSDLAIEGKDSGAHPGMPSEDDLAGLLFTSGTTGMAKGVMLSHKNIVSDVESLCEALEVTPLDNMISVLPLYHTFEATCGMLAPLAMGACVTYARSFKPREILKDIQDTKGTIILGVPLLYEMVLAGIYSGVKKARPLERGVFKTAWGLSRGLEALHLRPGKFLFKSFRKKAGMSSLRLMICGGAPLSHEYAMGFKRLGFTFLEGYGLTEASPVLTVNRLGKEKIGSVGQALPRVEVKIYNPDDTGVGEIIARGDNVMQGYFGAPQETEKVLRDGWLHTGDLGRLDKDGYLYITGRAKSLIVTKAGKNVYPEDIEDELGKSRLLKEVLVVGRTDPETKREKIHAIVFPDYEVLDAEAAERGKPFTSEEIELLVGEEVKKCNTALPDYKKIKEFEIRQEEFPKTSMGKIKRFLFQEKALKVT
jgi:long-chain acyl-CoA synthetase